MKHKSIRGRRIKKQQPSQKLKKEMFFEPQVQRKSQDSSIGNSKGFFNHFMNSINDKGHSLSNRQRAFFEARMQDDFSDVRIHRDHEAQNAAKEIGARAFTWENHIVLNHQTVESGSIEEKQIIAHELTHVQQQRKGGQSLQMLPEGSGQGLNQTEVLQNATEQETMALERDAEQEEERILAPESVPDFQTFGTPYTETVFANQVTFRAETKANFNSGVGTTRNLKRTPAEACAGCAENDCWHYTGQLVINYSVSTNVILPDVPQGLTECQHQRVRNAIDNVLAPHEQEHVKAFSQYNGTVTLPIDYTGCSDGIRQHVQGLHDTDEAARRSTVKAASAALDPFHVQVDLECGDERAAAAPEEPEAE